MNSNDNNIEIKSDKECIKSEDIEIEELQIGENNKNKNKNFKQ